MKTQFKNSEAGCILDSLIKTIQDNVAYLSEIDGAIGDGDHGINMNKGFSMCREQLHGKSYSLSEGFAVLSTTLMNDIGGSMGPLYGIFFDEMSVASADFEYIDAAVFKRMLENALAGIVEIGSAKRGDKSLLDTLIPAVESYSSALGKGMDFSAALAELKRGAESGWKSTKDMVAKIGRASRLGERSRGVLDAGATSCYLLLVSMCDTILKLLKE